MDKYYTPEPEELHVGLLIEHKIVPMSKDEQITWVPWLLRSYDAWGEDTRDLRVKYLDREDIESLGFEVVGGQLMPGGRVHCMDDYIDPRGLHDKRMITYTPSKLWALIATGTDETPWDDWSTRFCGTVKNISELRRILKQTEYEQK